MGGRGGSDKGNQRGGGHNSSQNNYHTITFFFSRKSSFYGHFSLSNFERTVSTQAKAAIEKCSEKLVFWNVLKISANDLKSRENPWKIHVNGFYPATLLKMNFFTDIFQGFCLDLRTPFFQSCSQWLSVAASISKFSLEMNNKEYFIVLVFLLWFLITHV